MLKIRSNIAALAAAAALALPVSPSALAGYTHYCMFNQGGYAASFHVQVVKRGVSEAGPSGSPISDKHFFGGRHGFTAGFTKCVTAQEAGVRDGDLVRIVLNPHWDINNAASRTCGPNRDRKRNNEGNAFLVPDGPLEGRLTFKSWGGLYNTSCELEHSDTERMHSACGEPRGMDNYGCNRFEMDAPWNLGTSGSRQIPDAVEQNTTPGQLYDLLSRGGYSPSQTHNDGSAGLHIAAREGYGGLLDVLVQRGADLDQPMDNGSTPVLEAMEAAQFGLARELILAGADPDLRREDGDFPLLVAARLGRTDLVELLMDQGARADALNPETGESPMAVARDRGDAQGELVAQVLISRGAQDRIHAEAVPNMIATDAGVGVLEQVLEMGADPNARTSSGLTGLHIAAGLGFSQYMALLRRYGADFNAQDNRGNTPLMTAIERGTDDFSRSLIFGGVDVNLGRRDGNFPLYFAVEQGRDDLVDVLLFAGENIEVNKRHPRSGKTALKRAVELLGERGEDAFQNISDSLLDSGGGL